MFTCISCTKPVADGEGEEVGAAARGANASSNNKEAVKSLTNQIKDMALKLSGTHKQCNKPSSTGSSSNYRAGHRPYPDFDTASEGVPYPYFGAASSSSTPAWDFPGRRGGGAEESRDVVIEDEDGPKEWMAQVEPGVHITFVSLPNGGNDLRRVRFSREMFNKWQAQRWWGENYDRIMELYNVQRFNRQSLTTPPRSEDEQRDSTYSRLGSARESPTPFTPRNYYRPSGSKGYFPSETMDQGSSQQHYPPGTMEASRTTTSSRDEPSISASNASELETEWVEEDEPGVYITIRQLADGTRELRRVRFSREKFGEVHAKSWWEENRDRIQTQYL
ncbi:Protein BREVIS RADIX [Linum perenne]